MSLKYWAEPETVYIVHALHDWVRNPDVVMCNEDNQSIGYFPIYLDKKAAEAEHPHCPIYELKLYPVPPQ